MGLITLKEILLPAKRKRNAVAAFDISTIGMLRVVLEAAEELDTPVIIMALPADLEGKGLSLLSAAMTSAAEQSSVPVCVQLDHAVDISLVKSCLDAGFSSVMYDRSSLSLEQNILQTGKIVSLASSYGASVEAELGHVGNPDVDKNNSEIHTSVLTRPVEMGVFIKETSVDALAVAIGTLHGVNKQKPRLEWDLLEHLALHSSVPLVLHGGVGTSDRDLKKLVQFGIRKVNIHTELLTAYYSSLKEELNKSHSMVLWPSYIEKKPLECVRAVAMEKMRILGNLQGYL